MAELDILWHETFRGYLAEDAFGKVDREIANELGRAERRSDGGLYRKLKEKYELNHYFGEDKHLYVSPEPEILYSASTKTGERVVDFSDDHGRAKKIFRQMIAEMKEDGRLQPVVWQKDGYYWRSKSSCGLNLRPGLLGGYPDQPNAVCLNDDVVHGVAVGRTGSGKSVLLNNLLVTLMDEYAPWELGLYIVDMKKVEFGAFMSKGQEGVHIRACAATSEVRYVLSMLRELEHTMQMRQSFFTAVGYKKLADFRADNPDLALPRILIVVDEFQQLMLNASSQENSELLRLITSITRLGRATGVHLLFASQEMAGTGVGGLLSNFKLRMALPCDASVSSEILGNNAAAGLGKGWVLVNCAGGDVDQNQRFQVPLADKTKNSGKKGGEDVLPPLENQYLQGHLQFVRGRARLAGFLTKAYRQRYYQEDLQHDIALFEKTVLPRIEASRFAQVNSSEKYLDIFALGSSVIYSNKAVDLESICIERSKNQNIYAVAPDADDLVYLQKLFVDNLASSPHVDASEHGIRVDYFSFDPVLASYYDIQNDPTVKDKNVDIRIREDGELPELICDLQLRKILFRYLSMPQWLPIEEFFARTSAEFVQALKDCQPYDADKYVPMYDTAILSLVRKNLLADLEANSKLRMDAIECVVSQRKVQVYDVDGEVEAVRFKTDVPPPTIVNGVMNVGFKLASRFSAKAAQAVVEEKPAENPSEKKDEPKKEKTLSDLDPKKVERAEWAMAHLKEILRKYIKHEQGASMQELFPLQVVMMSNANLSEQLSAGSPRRDIRVLHDNLVPLGPTYHTLFMYFFSETDGNNLRSAFNYFFVCGNRERDYDYCRMRFTNKMPGSIVVDCRIHNKNVERSFKKFRWFHAQPEAESLELDGIQNLYEEESETPMEHEPEEAVLQVRETVAKTEYVAQQATRPVPPKTEATDDFDFL